MKIISRFIIVLLICFSSLLNFGGCTLCGFGIGAIVDSGISSEEILPPSAIIASHKGDYIKIKTTSGYHYYGTFAAIDTNWTQDYSAEYEAARRKLAEHDTLIPALGEVLECMNKQEDQLMTISFLGVDYGESIWIDRQDGSITRTWPLSNISSLHNKEGRVYDTEALRLLMKQQLIPVRTTLTLKAENRTITLPMSGVKQIEQDNPKYWKFVGAGVGLAFDIAIISALSSMRLVSGQW
jgi:hypothetical protein